MPRESTSAAPTAQPPAPRASVYWAGRIVSGIYRRFFALFPPYS